MESVGGSATSMSFSVAVLAEPIVPDVEAPKNDMAFVCWRVQGGRRGGGDGSQVEHAANCSSTTGDHVPKKVVTPVTP